MPCGIGCACGDCGVPGIGGGGMPGGDCIGGMPGESGMLVGCACGGGGPTGGAPGGGICGICGICCGGGMFGIGVCGGGLAMPISARVMLSRCMFGSSIGCP
jgi:hypothetical protein